MASPDRSNLKNWLPGVAGSAILFAIVAFAGVAQNGSNAGTHATDAAAPAEQAKSEPAVRAAANAPSNTSAPPTKTAQPAPKATPASPPAPAAAPKAEAPKAAPTPAPGPAAKAAAQHNHGHAMPPAQTQAQAPASPKTPAAAAPAATTAAGVEGDVAHGRQVYKKCQACHSLEPGKNLLGPSLAGIVGTRAAEVPNYTFSTAMKQSGITWTPEKLDAYLADPQKVVPGNKMPFPGLKTDADRTDVIAFLAASKAGAAPKAPAAAAPAPAASTAAAPAAPSAPPRAVSYLSDAKYTLRSGIAEGRMVFLGVGGTIDGQVNPILTAVEGQVVQVTLINGEGTEHDIVFPDQDARSPRVVAKGASTSIVFRAGKAGDFTYFCDVPGHRLAGMEGQFLVTATPSAQTVVEADISRPPTDLPPPVGKRDPKTVRLDLLTVEMEGRLAEGNSLK